MTQRRYERYKESGSESLGRVPDHWERKVVKYLFKRTKIQDRPGMTVLSVYRDFGVVEKASRDDNNNKTPEDLSAYQLVQKGDLVINKMKAWQGSLGISGIDGITSPDYLVYSPLHYEHERYLHYLFRDRSVTDIFRSISNGIRLEQWRLEPENFERLGLYLPPLQEQQAIATFLDRETTKIDALVAEQERLIELLAEKRQAVISYAVTKGLDPTVEMKNSGVEWLGKVPAHWSVAAVGHRYQVALGKMLDEKQISGEFLAPYLRNTDVQWDRINIVDLPEMDFDEQERQRFSLESGDLLVCEGGEVGRCAIWQGALVPCFYQKALHRLRPLDSLRDTTRFMYYALRDAVAAGRFLSTAGKATIAHLPAEMLRRQRFAFPPPSEQAAIAAFLDRETSKNDELVAEAAQAIVLLQERRAALISAVVTGKIDVREQAVVPV